MNVIYSHLFFKMSFSSLKYLKYVMANIKNECCGCTILYPLMQGKIGCKELKFFDLNHRNPQRKCYKRCFLCMHLYTKINPKGVRSGKIWKSIKPCFGLTFTNSTLRKVAIQDTVFDKKKKIKFSKPVTSLNILLQSKRHLDFCYVKH